MRRRTEAQRLAIGRVKRVRFRRSRLRARAALASLRRRLDTVEQFLGRLRPPRRDDATETPTKSVRASVVSATLCLALTCLLVSGKTVEIADRLPLGADRDRWLAAADGTDRLANRLALNRPYDLLRDLRGAGDDLGEQVDVIGDIEDFLKGDLDAAGEQPDGAPAEAVGDGQVDPDGQAVAAAGTATGGTATGGTAAAGTVTPASTSTTTTTTTATTTTTTTTTTTVPEDPTYRRPAPVSAESPLRTFVVGDSQALYLGQTLRDDQISALLEITLDQRHSTGLARPSYFNWPVHLFAIAANHDPELVVATLGSNDWQDVRSEDGQALARGSAAWMAEWSRRLGVAFDVLEAPHRHVVWVGLPPTRSNVTREGYMLMNELAAAAASERGFVTMIDIWDLFGGDDPYRDAVPPPGDPDGRPVRVRQQDGIHLNRAGARWVVDLVSGEIERIVAETDHEPAPPEVPHPASN